MCLRQKPTTSNQYAVVITSQQQPTATAFRQPRGMHASWNGPPRARNTAFSCPRPQGPPNLPQHMHGHVPRRTMSPSFPVARHSNKQLPADWVIPAYRINPGMQIRRGMDLKPLQQLPKTASKAVKETALVGWYAKHPNKATPAGNTFSG